jgi:hypothetical protein
MLNVECNRGEDSEGGINQVFADLKAGRVDGRIVLDLADPSR